MERGRLRLKIGDVLVVLITLLLAAGAFAVFHWTRPDTQTQAPVSYTHLTLPTKA